MDWYNGFSPSEREAMDRAIRRGDAPQTMRSAPCAMCGDPSPTKIQTHAEDYSKPYRWTAPAAYPICIPCHRRLHARFKSRDRWEAYCAFLRRGFYGREVTNDDLKRQLALGSAYEWPTLSHEPPARDGKQSGWWESLTLDPASLTKRL